MCYGLGFGMESIICLGLGSGYFPRVSVEYQGLGFRVLIKLHPRIGFQGLGSRVLIKLHPRIGFQGLGFRVLIKLHPRIGFQG